MGARDVGLWAYLHPALGATALLLAFQVLRLGLEQRRLRRARQGGSALKRHMASGPWAAGLFGLAAATGVASAVLVRGWAPLATWHGRLGLAATAGFGVVFWLARALPGPGAKAHGLWGLGALFVGGLAALMGIALLP